MYHVIKVNPEKIRVIHTILLPMNSKEVQKLTGRMAVLSWFISMLLDKSHAFFENLKNSIDFKWDEKCESTLIKLKEYLTMPSLLLKPHDGEVLLLYMVISENALSVVLVR